MSKATEAFGIPELCGIIFAYLDNTDIHRLKNSSRGTRRFSKEYKPWEQTIFHRNAYEGFTVKPVLANTNYDPKRVSWIYTSGPKEGKKIPRSQREQETEDVAHAHYLPSRLRSAMQSSWVETEPAKPEQPSIAGSSISSGSQTSDSNTVVTRMQRFAYGTHPTQMQGVTLNWLLEDKFPRWKYYPISNMLGLEQELPLNDYFLNPDASYRPLLLMIPPLSEVTVMDKHSRMFDVKNDKGVTMGDVVDGLLEAMNT